MLRLLLLLVCCSTPLTAQAREAMQGELSHEECITCHRSREPLLVAAWQQSVHATRQPVAWCTSCHGTDHAAAASRSRRNDSCIECHGGAGAPVVHSYSTSKHGTIMQLEQGGYDWNLPLREANYRAPGCAYCHLHDGNHALGAQATNPASVPATPDMTSITGACINCHGPRYIARLHDTSARMIGVASMKLREARQLLDKHSAEHHPAAKAQLGTLIKQMEKHLRNVYLGAYHQSPDYQWWHGQPALDGDLLRIKGIISGISRGQDPGSE